MQSKKLHISEKPIREFVSRPQGNGGPAIRPSTYGKPVGLWYASGLEWIDRMQKVLSWQVTGEGNNFPYTRAYYNLVNKGTMLPWEETNEANRRRSVIGACRIHYVYDLTFDPALYSENPLEPSPTKILRLTPTCLDNLYTNVFLPFRAKYLKEQHHAGILADLENLMIQAKWEYYTRKSNPALVDLYGKLLKYLHDTKQLTKLMRDRYASGKGEIDLASEKYKEILKRDLLTGKLPMEGRLYDMFLRVWGSFWRDEIDVKWGGVDFPHEIFTPEYQSSHPEFGFIKYVEIPSGCFFTPPDATPRILFILTWSLPDQVASQLKKIQDQLLTIYSPEETKTFLLTRTYIATPTQKGEIRFHRLPIE